METKKLPKRKSWVAELIVALAACVCLLLYFNPRQHDDLVCIEGHENPNNLYTTQPIFFTSEIFFNKAYRVIPLYEPPTEFLLDAQLPGYYNHGDTLRLWILPQDQRRILEDPDIQVRAYAFECYNPDIQQWTRYKSPNPRGNGNFLAIGLILSILCLVMLVSKVYFTRAEDSAWH